jgi:hypothetical protein
MRARQIADKADHPLDLANADHALHLLEDRDELDPDRMACQRGRGRGSIPPRLRIANVRSMATCSFSPATRSITGPSWVSFSSLRLAISSTLRGWMPAMLVIALNRSANESASIWRRHLSISSPIAATA